MSINCIVLNQNKQATIITTKKGNPYILIKNLSSFIIDQETIKRMDLDIGLYNYPFYFNKQTAMQFVNELCLDFLTINYLESSTSPNYFLFFQFLSYFIKNQELLENITVLKFSQNSLYHIRHDIIVYSINKSYGVENLIERSFKEAFNLEDESIELNKTPDIIISKDDNYTVIEITVSINSIQSKIKKMEKYQPIIDYILLRKPELKIDFKVVSLLPNLSNLMQQIRPFLLSNQQLFQLTKIVESCQEMIYQINAYIGTPFDDSLPNPISMEYNNPNIESIEINLKESINSNNMENILNFTLLDKATDENFVPNIDSIADLNKSFHQIKEKTRLGYDEMTPKPTLHFVLDPTFFMYPTKQEGQILNESQLALDFFSLFSSSIYNLDDLSPRFLYLFRLSQKADQIERDPNSLNMYLHGSIPDYTRDQFNQEKKKHIEDIKAYKKLKSQTLAEKMKLIEKINSTKKENEKTIDLNDLKKPKFTSYLDTVQERTAINKLDLTSQYKKAMKVNINKNDTKARLFYVKAGITQRKKKDLFKL